MDELTDKELNGLTDDELFDYLDERANYLKNHSYPLNSQYLKRFAHMDAKNRGTSLTLEEHRNLTKILKENQQRFKDNLNGDITNDNERQTCIFTD
jgi:hypothetical protein